MVCALLFFATTINYMDRQLLSLLKPILDNELDWSNAQFGLVNSLFQGAYAASYLAFGWFVDKYGTRIGYAVSITLWSLAAAAHALVGTVAGFGIARIALGLGEGGNFPAAIKSVAEWFPRKERAFATTLFNSGANVGALLAPAIVPPIALAFGWHGAFLAAGLAGLVWLAFWLAFYEVPRRAKRLSAAELAYIESGDEQPNDGTIPWISLIMRRQTWAYLLAGMVFPLVCGLILDSMGGAGYSILFGYCSAAYLVAFALNSLLCPRFEPMR
jgi:ACS family hexuronate transporter-like MFS transporter